MIFFPYIVAFVVIGSIAVVSPEDFVVPALSLIN